MTYKILTAPLSVSDAEAFGAYLKRYAIQIGGLTVRHQLQDGRWVTDRPLADTVSMVSGSTATATAAAPPTAGIMAAVGLTIPVIAVPALLATLAASIGLYHHNRKRLGHPKAVHSELAFDFANVSPRRLAWAELLISTYSAQRQWHILGLRYPAQQAAGFRFVQAHNRNPIPWSTMKGGKR